IRQSEQACDQAGEKTGIDAVEIRIFILAFERMERVENVPIFQSMSKQGGEACNDFLHVGLGSVLCFFKQVFNA
ncbi:hypothetical protein, partial [Acinetobacter baumannii]|uniref:hypothetical protein n=1 Tax=Acinetobacter baumannii TaxID=470 RepID=UPI00148774D0